MNFLHDLAWSAKRVFLAAIPMLLFIPVAAACGEDDVPPTVETIDVEYNVENALDGVPIPYDDWPSGIVYRTSHDQDDAKTEFVVDMGGGPSITLFNRWGYEHDDFPVIAVGDAVAWSPDGDDFSIQADEIIVIRAGAALNTGGER